MKRIIITLLFLGCFIPIVSAQSGSLVVFTVEGVVGFGTRPFQDNAPGLDIEIGADGGTVEVPLYYGPITAPVPFNITADYLQGTPFFLWMSYDGIEVKSVSPYRRSVMKFTITPNTSPQARVITLGSTFPAPQGTYQVAVITQSGSDGSGNLKGFDLSSSSHSTMSAGYPGYRYSINLSGSELGVEYVLMHNEEDIARLQGTGQPLSFTSDWGAGIFSVVATRGSNSKAMNNFIEMTWLHSVQNGYNFVLAADASHTPSSPSFTSSSIIFDAAGGQCEIVIMGYPIADEAVVIADSWIASNNNNWDSAFRILNRRRGFYAGFEAVYLTVEAGPNTSSATRAGTISVGVNPNGLNQTLYVSQEPRSLSQTSLTQYDLYTGNPTNIYLSGSDVGAVYKLYSNGMEIKSLDGTGSPLIFSGTTQTGPFTAKAFRGSQTANMRVITSSIAEERLSGQREITYNLNTGEIASVNSTVFDKLGRPVESELQWSNYFYNKADLLGYDEAGYKSRFAGILPDVDESWEKWEQWREKMNYSKRVATDYDAAGRPYRERLLLPAELEYQINGNDYYDGYYSEPNTNQRRAYTEVAYDNTPQSRIVRESPAGLLHGSYANGQADHRMEYGKNTPTDAIKRFILSGTSVSLSGTYAVGALQKNAVSGPHGQTTAEFRNAEGQLIASREAANHFTHYVYDDLGRLRYVIPPLMDSLFTSGTRTRTELEPLCYWYDYDEEGRVYKKHVPGAGVATTLYNKRGQVVLYQDARMAFADSQGKSTWVFTKYDEQGRIAQTGTCKGAEAQHKQALAAQRVFHEKAVYITPDDKIHWVTIGGKTYQGLDPNYGSKSDDTPTLGYTTLAYPTQISEADLLTVNFYDTYEWYEHGAHSFQATQAQGSGHIWSARGLQTGFKERILNTNKWLTTTFYYNSDGLMRQKISDMPITGVEVESYLYDSNGNLSQTRVRQSSVDILPTVVAYDRFYTYDDAGNIQRIEQEIVGDEQNGRVTLATYWYDYQGRLSRKWLNGLSDIHEYTYGVGDMLTGFGSATFDYQLKRDDATTPRFDGNIGGIQWTSGSTWASSYTYDALGRLKTSSEGTTTATYSYDRNGNIASMPGMRAEYGVGKNGNALNKLTKNGVTHTGYTYDSNGNMTHDAARGINISYNILNLPSNIGSASYMYTATGRKVAMSTSSSTTHYQGDVVYNNLHPVSIAHPEGEVLLHTNNIFAIGFDAEYRYFCKDHLGSVQKVLSYDDDWSGAYTEYQSNKYLPFGGLEFEDNLAENKTLFTGKELQDSRVGNDILRLYDFGARYYDPTVARWTSIDPFAEMYYSRSPYNYVGNNPISRIDPDGRAWIEPVWVYGKPQRAPWRYDGLDNPLESNTGLVPEGWMVPYVADIPLDQLKGLERKGGWRETVNDVATYTGAGLTIVEHGVLNPANSLLGKLHDISQANNLGINYLKEDMILRQTGKYVKYGGRIVTGLSIWAAYDEYKQTEPGSDAQAEAMGNVVMNAMGALPFVGAPFSIYWNVLGGRQLNMMYVEKVLVPRMEMIRRQGADLAPWDIMGFK